MTLKIDQLTNFLSDRTHGMRCPVCGESKWYIKADKNGDVATTDLSNSMAEAIVRAIEEFGEENGVLDGTKEPPNSEASILCSCLLVRCNNCGRIELFDANFIEKESNNG